MIMTTTNKDQLEWLKGMEDGGKLERVGSADVNLDGVVESLSGEDALAALRAMGEDELGASVQDPILASADSSDSSGLPSESQNENPDPTEQLSIRSEGDPSENSSGIGGEPETEPATDAEAVVQPARTGERPIEGS